MKSARKSDDILDLMPLKSGHQRSMAKVLYSGKHIRLYDQQIPGCEDLLVISFPVMTPNPSFSKSGFAERWLSKYQIPAIEVKVSSNHWFQVQETDEAMAVIAGIAARYRRVVTYGSSMGGYAAISCSGAIGAHAAIAISPQSTIDPQKVPWEVRWTNEAATIRESHGFHRDDLAQLVRSETEVYVVADPWDPDARHARAIQDAVPQTRWLMAHGCGHSAAGGLVEYKMLGRFATDMMRHGGDVMRWRTELRQARSTSPRYWSALSNRAIARGKHGYALARSAARMVALHAPADDLKLTRAAGVCLRTGDTDAALDILKTAEHRAGVSAVMTLMHADVLYRMGQYGSARSKLEQALLAGANLPKVELLRSRLDRVQAATSAATISRPGKRVSARPMSRAAAGSNGPSTGESTAVVARRMIFKGNDLEVVYCPTENRSALIVTFTNFSTGIPTQGFGEEFIRKQGYSGLYFMERDNHWWQTPEIFKAIAAVKSAGLLETFPQRIGYGSSMGAYAVLLFSVPLELTSIIALSPQYSIQRSKVPFERRWKSQSQQIKFIYDDMALAAQHGEAHIFYDPFHPDGKHAKLISGQVPCHLYRVPFAGHPVSRFMAETRLLKSTVLGLIDGTFSGEAFASALRVKRRQSKQFYFGLARAAFASGRLALAKQVAARGLALDNTNSALWRYKVMAEIRLGDIDAARLSVESYLEVAPDNQQAKLLMTTVRTLASKRKRIVRQRSIK